MLRFAWRMLLIAAFLPALLGAKGADANDAAGKIVQIRKSAG